MIRMLEILNKVTGECRLKISNIKSECMTMNRDKSRENVKEQGETKIVNKVSN